jgi:type II secretory pathway component GspD/PulD (secretin)
MKKHTCNRILVFMLAVGPCIPCNETSPQVLAATSDEYALRLLDYNFQQMPIALVVQKIAETECLKIMFDESVAEFVKSTQISLRLMKSSPMRALAILFDSQQLNYEYTGDRTLVIFRRKAPENVKLMDIIYRDTNLITSIEQISQLVGLKIRLHNSAQMYRGALLTITLRGISALHGLELILNSRRLTYEYIDCGTIIIFPDESVRLT